MDSSRSFVNTKRKPVRSLNLYQLIFFILNRKVYINMVALNKIMALEILFVILAIIGVIIAYYFLKDCYTSLINAVLGLIIFFNC